MAPSLRTRFSLRLNFTMRLNGLKKKEVTEYKRKIIPRIIEIEIMGFILNAPIRSRWER